jgi:2-polyprenyl-3-methyl-5-hydroxy-6-metoxy-1,4-benzoquinol methylase
LNQKKIDELSERILNETNAAMNCLNLYLGYKLNLFKYIVEAGPVTSTELANKTKYSERYLREWLECMAVLNYIDYDSNTSRFSISQEHAVVFCDRDNIAYTIPFVNWIPSLASVIDNLVKAFQTGEGIAYSEYGNDLIEAQGEGNRPMFVNEISNWVSSMTDIYSKLKTEGGNVADVGCGDGWTSIALAESLPLIKIDAIDLDSDSIKNARRNIEEAKLSNRICTHLTSIEKLSTKYSYDLVMAFECIHDMPYPVEALRTMRKMASKGGVFIADVKMGETLEEKKDFAGRLYYNFSVLLCLPQSLIYPNSKGTGAAMTPSTFERYVKEAGYSKIEILPIEHTMWRFYHLTP